jgi:hypothetical protein
MLLETSFLSARKKVELSMIDSFKRKAPSVEHNLPPNDDHLSWLALMQHYGGKTRLLDWTESILVALYFAVETHHEKDGEIWCMVPWDLNEKSSICGLPLTSNRVLRFLAEQPYMQNCQEVAEEWKIALPGFPLAFEPVLSFPRVLNQKGRFTIHPPPQEGNTLPDLLKDNKSLVRYVIPAASKSDILRKLTFLGIDKFALFPDLQSLCDAVFYEHKIIAYYPPEPPTFGAR